MQDTVRRLEAGDVLSGNGVSPGAQSFLAVLLHQLLPGRPVMVVASGLKEQEALHQDIATWLNVRHAQADVAPRPESPAPDARLFFYPAWEVLPHEGKLPHADVISERLETLAALAALPEAPTPESSGHPLVVTQVTALLQRTYPPQQLRQRLRILRQGESIDPLDLIEWLEDLGYEPEAQVSQKGEIALRGGILDVFPPASLWPVRLEFFGNQLESLRFFDPISQISREPIPQVTLSPAGELGVLRQELALRGGAPESGAGPSNPAGQAQPALATLMDYLPRSTVWLLCEPAAITAAARNYAELVPADDPFYTTWEAFQAARTTAGMPCLELTEEEAPSEPEGHFADGPRPSSSSSSSCSSSTSGVLRGRGRRTRTRTSTRPSGESAHSPSDEAPVSPDGRAVSPADQPAIQFAFSSLEAFRPIAGHLPAPQVAEAQRREFFGQLHRWTRQGYCVHVFCNNEGERRRFGEIWVEYGLGGTEDKLNGQSSKRTRSSPSQSSADSVAAGASGAGAGEAGRLNPRLAMHLGTLTRGFFHDAARLVVVTDAEIFGRYKVQRPRRLKSPHAQTSRSLLDIDFTDLEVGDYVVHVQHGIGRYLGLEVLPPPAQRTGLGGAARRAVPESGQECLVLEYAPRTAGQPPPRLYVPITEAHVVSKYVGAGKAQPNLNSLGGARWNKAKEQAARAVRDLAAELLAIQAARESLPGHAYAPDAPWQREFEGAFLYEETPDQMRAIGQTKADMEAAKPMDRLICGDVGYGKTEVAIRAAFKAVMGGKQVAVLVPTTILAQQHFNTFRERMADYPIRVEMLSRFRTRREQQRAIAGLANGAVDIVIGTHRLVQGDITFKELGLVVIDEEQRFGVQHKEKFKRLRRLVDVLTLSATPIPRTLYLALTGARDMSTIETPPQDRLPVETIIARYDERIIRDAIQREMNRGGQVFFLHNRVLDIAAVATRLAALLPKARIVVGHGQMRDDELEAVMAQFINGQADVLLSTTIIESGIDIPNANTILINRADRFGLSDLYQLRGRVGRYKHQAYAYLLIPRHANLLSDARKRISAIRQYSSLGSGFKIAMRDLEIRGAGNLLGPEQSGHIAAVGFDLYCQLLKQSVARLKGQELKPRVEVPVRLDFLATNPGAEGRQESSKIRAQESKRPRSGDARGEPEIHVPRDTATYVSESEFQHPASSIQHPASNIQHPASSIQKAAAYIPLSYIAEPHLRVEIYRKLAAVTEASELEKLKAEIKDRFGPLPEALRLLLQVYALKLLASERGVTSIETNEDKLKVIRNGDYLMLAGRFPRLTKTTAKGRLNEIRRLLLEL